MIKRLRFKFVIINMGIVTIMLCVILGLVFHFTRSNLENENINMMRQIALQPFALGLPDTPGEEVRLPYFKIQVGPKGERITTDSGYYDLSDGEFLDGLIRITFSSVKTFGVIPEYKLRYYRVDTPFQKSIVFSDISSEITTLNNLTQNCILIGGLSFFLFLGVSILLSKWAVKPVEQAWKQQRQFVADASHELKTPLTVILTNAQLAQSTEFDEENRKKFLSSIVTMSRQMKGLIEQLLALARADAAEKKADFSDVNFGKLVTSAVLTFEPVFYENGIALESQIDDGIKLAGDETKLRQAVEILLDNAVKYTKEGGKAWVSLQKRSGSHCLLTVADEGDPLSEEELSDIFKRFYRADQARSSSGSFGLGLPIAESIVNIHKGKIWAESKNGINSFLVLLPRVSE